MGVALASTLAGGGTGLLVKKGSYRALVGDTARNKYYYDLQDSARLLTRACIELKNKQSEVIHENSEDLNQKN